MVRGLTKVRNEEYIITQTLDNWAQYCDAIHVYDDCSEDGTADLCREHPAVVEVVSSNHLDPDRMRAEWYNRNLILQSALRFKPDWVCYFDADEWLYEFDGDVLEDNRVNWVDCDLYDVHITLDDLHDDPAAREWVDPKPRRIGFFFRVGPELSFSRPDQRIMNHMSGGSAVSGKVKHFGKGWSVEQWERKCDYYEHEFGHPAYGPKWRDRRGKAVKVDGLSDDGDPLVKWSDL